MKAMRPTSSACMEVFSERSTSGNRAKSATIRRAWYSLSTLPVSSARIPHQGKGQIRLRAVGVITTVSAGGAVPIPAKEGRECSAIFLALVVMLYPGAFEGDLFLLSDETIIGEVVHLSYSLVDAEGVRDVAIK